MRIKKEYIRTTLIFVVVIFAMAGCRNNAPKPTITIGTFSRAIDYSPYYVARHFRWFEGAPGLEQKSIKYVEFNDRDAISSAFSTKSLDAVFAAEPPLILTRAQGNEIRVVEVSCTLQQEILVRQGIRVQSVSDLKGKSIAVLLGTSSHYGLLKILKSGGLQPEDVNIRFMSPDEARIAFETGKIDAWAVWPPFVEQEVVNGKGHTLAGGNAVINSIMAVPKLSDKKNEEITRGLVTAIQQAKSWIQSHPDEAQTIVADELKLDRKVVGAAWGKHDWGAHLTQPVIEDIQDKADFLASEKLTRNAGRVDVRSSLIDTQYTPSTGVSK